VFAAQSVARVALSDGGLAGPAPAQPEWPSTRMMSASEDNGDGVHDPPFQLAESLTTSLQQRRPHVGELAYNSYRLLMRRFMSLLHFAALLPLVNASRIVLVIGLASSVGACANQPAFELSRAGSSSATRDIAKAERPDASTPIAEKTSASPINADTAIAAARALRTEGDPKGALALLERSAVEQPSNRALQRERGLLALELGQIAKAEPLLRQALDNSKTDWQTHSAFGAALASAGRHQEAQQQFAKALALAPDHPSILNNLALSYALDGKPAEAERLLRIAAARRDTAPQVKQNLALVLGAGGKLAEAQKLSNSTLPRAKADANTVYLKSLSEQANATRGVQTAEARPGEPSSNLHGATNKQ
jgi:Flp pilus assembly protein TadD